jgi:hypothetical protein
MTMVYGSNENDVVVVVMAAADLHPNDGAPTY